MYECKTCSKKFPTVGSRNAHMRSHSPTGKSVPAMACCVFTKKVMKASSLERWDPRRECVNCGEVFYTQWGTKTCSQSCAASVGNTGRVKSEATKEKIRSSVSKGLQRSNNRHDAEVRLYMDFCGPYTRLVKNVCAHSGRIFFSRRQAKYHSDYIEMYARGRNVYSFTFNVFDYPDLFDLDEVKRIGFYSHGGKYGKRENRSGLTRDHRVSVNEAVKNGYDPFYVTHPLNCELMTFSDNDRKKTRSSLSYADLVSLVDEYEFMLR